MQLHPRDALRLSGVTQSNYDAGSRLRAFSAFPQTSKGRARQFVRDDVLAMNVQANLCRLGVANAKSWEIAGDLRKRLREAGEACDVLYVVAGRDGGPSCVLTKLPPGRVFYTVRVAELRMQITAAAGAK